MEPTLEHAYSLLLSTPPSEAMEYILAQADQIFQTELELEFFQAILSYYQDETEKCYHQFDGIFDALLQNPNQLMSWWDGVELIDVLLLNDETAKATSFIEAHLKLNPFNPALLNEQGLVYYLKLDYEKAIESYRKALDLIPDGVPVMVNLGLAYSKTGQTDLAFEWLEKAIDGDDEELTSTYLALDEIIKNSTERCGDCDSCKGDSLCCKNMKLKLNEVHVNSEHTYQQALALDSRNSNWIHSKSDDDGSWIFNCRYLDLSGKCSNHLNRPQTCRDFPDVFYAKHKFTACSYTFKLKTGLPEITSPKVKKAVQSKLKALGFNEVISIDNGF